jgi:hypothetical protein
LQTPKLTTRSNVNFNPKSYREEDDSVEFVLTTEYPVDIFDWSTGKIIKETMVAKGITLPQDNQVPLLNSHNRFGIENILGSVRDFKVEGDKVVGRLYFSKKKEAQEALQMIKEGHLNSGSVGYLQRESVWIKKGEKLDYDNRTFEGPLLLTKKWDLQEYSLVAIPADPFAKARNSNETDSLSAVKNINPNFKGENTMENEKETKVEEQQPTVNVKEAVEQASEKARADEQARVRAIIALCNKHNCKDIVDTLISTGASVEAAQGAVLDELAKRSTPLANAKPVITMGETDREKFVKAAADGLLLRAGVELEKPEAGAENFRRFSIKEVAREIARRNGENGMMTDKDALMLVSRAGTQTYSDFNYVLDTAMQKSVTKGYRRAPDTWRQFCSKGSLPNLEPAKRVDINDLPDFDENPEGAQLDRKIIGDKGEQIQLVTYGNTVSLSRRAILADDLGIFGRIARKIGYRAAQKIEALAYSVLTANANMSDDVALFHADHHNLAAGAGNVGALSKATLGNGYVLMQKQTDANGSKLNITPKYLLVSPDEAIEAEILTASTIDPSSNFTAGNTNFFKNRNLVAISSPYINVSSNGFYLIADPAACDTIEVAFLDGKESPTIEMVDNDGDILARKWRYWFDVGAKALDFRGMVRVPHS